MNSINAKLLAIATGVLCVMLLIFARLAYLQIHLNQVFIAQSQKNFTRIEKQSAPRGDILDVNGIQVATNRPIANVYWCGSGKRTLTKEQHKALCDLQTILSQNILTDDNTCSRIKYAERRYRRCKLATDISFEQLSQIEELFSHHPNVQIETTFKRFYPYKSSACHILGYLGRLDMERIGKMGLEKLFEQELKGKYGTISKTINSLGRNLGETELQRNLAGGTIYTTLDISLQQLAERIFPTNESGAFILMDPYTGAIRALVSYPTFDPSIFLNPILHDDWQTLQEKKPFLNRAFNASYPPGSIFKLVTTCAALEHNFITPEDTQHCKGYIHFGKRKYWCHRRQGHGDLTSMQSLAKSCNILFFDVGKSMNIDLLAKYAHMFGLGHKTGVIFHEQNGLIPTHAWKQEMKGERWWQGETLSATIGQSFLLATPIQIARMVASIFTGYLVKPRILVNEPIEKQPLMIQPETRDFLQRSMKSVVTIGTGKRINKIKNIEIYAKTSTAQTADFYKRNLGKEYKEHGWFVAYFSYKNNPPLALVLLLENAGTARVATAAVKDFLIEYKKMIDA